MKTINDRDGHAAGDRVLQTLVETIRSNLRSFDPVMRYGGDEFVCGLSGIDISDVELRFQAIDRALKSDVGAGAQLVDPGDLAVGNLALVLGDVARNVALDELVGVVRGEQTDPLASADQLGMGTTLAGGAIWLAGSSMRVMSKL